MEVKDMMKRLFKLEAIEWNMKNEALTIEANGISVDYRHFSSTCPNPGRVNEHTQNWDLLPQNKGEVGQADKLNSPSWGCFKENTSIGALYSLTLEKFTFFQGVLGKRCYETKFSV